VSGVTAGGPFPEDFEVGTLKLRSSNSQDPPILDPNLFSNDLERQLLYAFGSTDDLYNAGTSRVEIWCKGIWGR
jgi:hypothetical protein